MPIPNRPSNAARIFGGPIVFNNPPPFPTEYSKSQMAQHKDVQDSWWHDHKASLTEIVDRLLAAEARINELTPAPTGAVPVPVNVKI